MDMFASEPPNMEIHSFDEPLSLYLSVCLSIHPPIHPSISLPPSLALSLSLLSLSLDASFDVKSTLDLFAGGNSDVSDIYAWLDCVCFSLSLWGIIKCVCHAPASFGWMWTSLVSFERFSKSMAHTLCYFSAAMLWIGIGAKQSTINQRWNHKPTRL